MRFDIKQNAEWRTYEKHWQFSVGSCHAPLALRKDYLEQLKLAVNELGFKRVRFHGIFNDDMNVGLTLKQLISFIPSTKKFKEISFRQVGLVYDNLLELGVRPFVELGFMPGILASGKRQCNFRYRGNVTMPKSLEEWGEFIKNYMRFLIGRYGEEEISQWYFEVWNEPNLPVFFAGSKKDYFNLYDVTARAVKEVCPGAKVGGPSSAGYGWIEDFAAHVEKSGAPCDFVSTHHYSGAPYGGVPIEMEMIKGVFRSIRKMRKSKGGNILDGTRILFKDDSELKEHDISNFARNAAKAKECMGGLPLYLTEWGANATCTAEINDTIKTASFIVKCVLDSEGVLDGSSYWCFSDIFEELMPYPYEFSGAFGMITIDGIPKPQFWAFKLLSMLGGERTQTQSEDGVEMTAFRKEDKLQALLFNQSFKKTDFNKEAQLTVECASAPKSAVIYRIDETHCNPYDIWKARGAVQNPPKSEIELIKKESAMTAERIDFEYADGAVTMKTRIGCNNVALIELEL